MNAARTRPRVGFLLEQTLGHVAHGDVHAGRRTAVTASAIAAPAEETR